MQRLLHEIRTFREERDWDRFHSPKNLAMALIVEAAELCEEFQWLTEDESAKLPDQKKAAVTEELADVLIYLLNLADKLDIDPLAAAHAKLEKNRKRFPAERVRGRAD